MKMWSLIPVVVAFSNLVLAVGPVEPFTISFQQQERVGHLRYAKGYLVYHSPSIGYQRFAHQGCLEPDVSYLIRKFLQARGRGRVISPAQSGPMSWRVTDSGKTLYFDKSSLYSQFLSELSGMILNLQVKKVKGC